MRKRETYEEIECVPPRAAVRRMFSRRGLCLRAGAAAIFRGLRCEGLSGSARCGRDLIHLRRALSAHGAAHGPDRRGRTGRAVARAVAARAGHGAGEPVPLRTRDDHVRGCRCAAGADLRDPALARQPAVRGIGAGLCAGRLAERGVGIFRLGAAARAGDARLRRSSGCPERRTSSTSRSGSERKRLAWRLVPERGELRLL